MFSSPYRIIAARLFSKKFKRHSTRSYLKKVFWPKLGVELVKCDTQFEKEAGRDACDDSALELSENRVRTYRKG